MTADRGRTLVAVPLYRSPELIEELFDSLVAIADEMTQLLLINDSPECPLLAAELDRQLPRLREAIHVELIVNDENLGFVRSANRAFEAGIARRCDVLLLNSDARPRPGAFTEMKAVAALDPMIGFVSPRSNNATLCNSPYPAAWRTGSPEEAYRHHRMIERFLPRYSYVPTAVGFCLYVRLAMIEEFGVFDEIYGGGYNEENDLIRRCNRRGYRAALANHAYVDHLGGVSFAASPIETREREERNRAILIDRYPEYPLAVRRYHESPDYRAQCLLAGLVPLPAGRLRILFDCRTLTCSHKGSFEHCRHLLGAFAPLAADRFDVFVLCERDAFEFHALNVIPNLHFCEQSDVHDRPFAVAMRLVQPFLLQDIVALADYAPVTGFLILDTIAMDCQQLDTHGLDTLWRFMVEATSLIGYNSEFTRDQFRQRIAVWPHVTEFVSRCSTDVADYARSPERIGPSDRILVVGNDYPHKHVAETVAAIRAARPDVAIDILGLAVREEPDALPSGLLDADKVDTLYREAGVVVFPSHYEGFGFPILHGLARHRPVVARDLPAAREIAQRAAGGANLHLAASTSEMVDLATHGLSWQPIDPAAGNTAEGWGEAARAVLDAIETALKRFDFATCRRQQAAIIGHRARLDAERQFHDGAARSVDLQAEAGALAEKIAASEARLASCERDLDHARAEQELALRQAASADTQREAALREAVRARNAADHARWQGSQAAAREWDAKRHADRSEERLSLILRAPHFDVPVPVPVPAPARGAALRARLLAWPPSALSRSLIRGRLEDAPPAPPLDRADRLHLSIAADHPPLAEWAERVLEWTDLLAVGGRFRIDVAGPSSGEPDRVEQDARALMHALGCTILDITRRRKRLRLAGIKLWDARWTPAEPTDNALFLEASYSIVLRRKPDPAGTAGYLAAMATGMSHSGVVRSMLTSRERFDLVSSDLARGGDAHR